MRYQSKPAHFHMLYNFPNSNLPVTREMLYQSRPAHLQMLSILAAASLEEYENQTGIALSEHPLAEQVRQSDSAESVTAILQEQLTARSGRSALGGTGIIMNSLSSVVSVLYTLSVEVNLNWVRSKMLFGLFHLSCLLYSHSALQNQYIPGLLSYSLYVSFLHSYVRVFDVQMLQTVKDVSALDPLVDLLESIESIVKHIDIYSKVPHTATMTETVMETLVELLSILGLATKLVKQRQPGEPFLDGILSGSTQSRDTCKEVIWREF